MGLYFKNIDWEFNPLIDMDLMRFEKRVTVIPNEDINPELVKLFKKLKLKLLLAEIFYSSPGFQSLAHVDGSIEDTSSPWPSRCKINWVNIPTTRTQWYEILPENRNKAAALQTAIGTNFINYNSVPKTVIENAYLSGWHLFESGVPHKVINNSNDHRWCMSFVTCPVDQLNGWATMDVISNKLGIYCPESAAGEATLLTSGKM